MKTLRPQHLSDADTADMERQLKRIFWALLFKPLGVVIERFTEHPAPEPKEIRNAFDDPLREALREGRIQYHEGAFSGELSASVSKVLRQLGATWDKRSKVYRLDTPPPWIRAEAAAFKERARRCHDALKEKLAEIQTALDEAVDVYTVEPTVTLGRVEKGFQKVARELAVLPELGTHSKEQLNLAYTENMKLWIKKWSSKQIMRLRGEVEQNAVKGYRFAPLVKRIQRQYNVSASKAKFLARQETGLFMAKYRKERFTAAGVDHYRWSTSHDARVRDQHKHLDTRIFSYKSPPIVDPATGRRANPGEDFNCRCVDIPIVGRLELEEAA